MKSILKAFLFFPFLFIFSCSNFRSTDEYKIVLNLSLNTYITSLTNGKIVLSDEHKNGATDKQIVDEFIDSYSRQKTDKWLLDVFSENEMLPKFESIAELKQFILFDYNARISKMHEVILNRISNFTGTSKDKIKIKQTKNQIIVFVSGIEDKTRLEAAFENRNGINFWEVATLNEISPLVAKFNDTLTSLVPKSPRHIADTGKEMSLQETIAQNNAQEQSSDVLFKVLQPSIDQNGRPYGASFWAIASVKDTAKINAYLASPVYKAIFPENMKMLWGDVAGRQDNPRKVLALYAIRKGFADRPLMDGSNIKSAKFENQNYKAEIMIDMDAKGAVDWANATQKCVGKPIAIEMNNFILSAPNVNEKIIGGHSVISGVFSATEGDNLALAISSGPFPLDFKLVSIEKYTD